MCIRDSQVLGVIEPLVVSPRPEGGYTVIQGHRRLKALTQIGWTDDIPILVDNPEPEGALGVARAVASDNVRRPYRRSVIGMALRRLAREQGWASLHRCAAAFGMDVPDAEAHLALLDADPKVRERVDRGEIAWTTWRLHLQKAPKQVQAEIASMEKPTGEAVRKRKKQIVEQLREADETRMLDDEALIFKMNGAVRAVEEVLDAQPWGPDVAPQLRHLLERLLAKIDQDYLGTKVAA